MPFKHLSISILLCLFSVQLATSQSTCTESLLSAQRLYNEGIIEEIPNILKPCLENGFTRNESIEAYKLLILAYLFDDNQFEAENAILEFLKQFPDYELMPNDPIEFVYFYKTFEVIPKVSFGFATGINLSNVQVTKNYTTGNQGDLMSSDKIGFGYNFYGNFSVYLRGRYGINSEINYGLQNYSFEDQILDFSTVKIKESVIRFTFPVSFTIDLSKSNYKPYVRIGGGISYLNETTIIPERSFSQPGRQSVVGADIDLTNHREQLNYFVTGGAGLKIIIGKGFLFIDARYNYRFLNEMKAENRYKTPELWSRYYYIEDDFLLQNYELNVGYNFSIFKAIKK
jgi:hypothetical protein